MDGLELETNDEGNVLLSPSSQCVVMNREEAHTFSEVLLHLKEAVQQPSSDIQHMLSECCKEADVKFTMPPDMQSIGERKGLHQISKSLFMLVQVHSNGLLEMIQLIKSWSTEKGFCHLNELQV